MKYHVEFSDAAEDDVAELLDYLVPRAGEHVARRYVDRLIDHCYSFEIFPESGVRVDADPELRLGWLSPARHHCFSRSGQHSHDRAHFLSWTGCRI